MTARRSLFQGACAAGFAGLCFYAWWRTGEVPQLIAAGAFAAFAVAWYGMPISFTKPFRSQVEEAKANAKFRPKWAMAATAVGVALLFVSLGVRVGYWLLR
jgi:hypothetical protein